MRAEIRSILKSLRGAVHDAKVANGLVDKVGDAKHFIVDKRYDSDAIPETVRRRCVNPIRRKSNSKKPNPEFDSHLYKLRHLVENLFARLKYYRSIATRFEKLSRNLKTMLFFACNFIWIKVK